MKLKLGQKMIVAHTQSTTFSVYDYAIDEVVGINKRSYKLKSGATISDYFYLNNSGISNDGYFKSLRTDYEDRFVGVLSNEKFSTSGCSFYVFTEEKLKEVVKRVENELTKRRERKEKYERREEAMKPYYEIENEAKRVYDEMIKGKWAELLCTKCIEQNDGYCKVWKENIFEGETGECTGFKIER